MQEAVRRNLQTEIAAYATTLRRLRDEIESVQLQRQNYADKCEDATQVFDESISIIKILTRDDMFCEFML